MVRQRFQNIWKRKAPFGRYRNGGMFICIRYTGHWIKRGSVPLHGSLGMRDEMVKKLVQMTGPLEYTNYCTAYHECGPNDIPRMYSVTKYSHHAEKVFHETSIVRNGNALNSFMQEFGLVYEGGSVLIWNTLSITTIWSTTHLHPSTSPIAMYCASIWSVISLKITCDQLIPYFRWADAGPAI